MGYERDQDKTLWEREVDISDPMGKASTKYKFVVSIMSYMGGKPKLDIKRLSYGAYRRGRYEGIGRLSFYDLSKLIPLITEAKEKMGCM